MKQLQWHTGALLMTAAALMPLSPAIASEWAYEGATGPAEWGMLSEANAACLGQQQSPIDLVTTNTANIDPIAVDWSPMSVEVVDNGHTVQANAAPGSSTRFGNRRFDLLQVHFHAASEHTFLGKHFPVEAHFVHRSPEGDLLVLGVMIEEGAGNPVLQTIWGSSAEDYSTLFNSGTDAHDTAAAIDTTVTHSIDAAPIVMSEMVDLSTILPSNQGRFQYAGSLTTPPCSEIVNWVVFSTPVTASAEQIEMFTSHYSNNYRPVQKRNRRFVLYGD